MRKKLITHCGAATTLCLLLFAGACNTDSLVEDPTSKELDYHTAVVLKKLKSDKYLHFSSLDSFYDSLRIFSTIKYNNFKRWEREKEFVSLQSIYENVEDYYISKEKHYVNLLNIGSISLKEIDFPSSPFSNEIINYIYFDIEEGLILNLFDENMAKFLNKDGLVKISSSIYQFTDNGVKVIVNGDESEIPNLNKVNSRISSSSNIKFSEVHYISDNPENSAKSARSKNYRRCMAQHGNSNGDYKIIGEASAYWIAIPYGPGQNVRQGAWIGSHFLRKSFIIGWNNHKTENYSISGNWSIVKAHGNECDYYPENYVSHTLYGGHTNFAGKTARASITIYPECTLFWHDNDYPLYSPVIDLYGTTDHQFIDLNCTIN